MLYIEQLQNINLVLIHPGKRVLVQGIGHVGEILVEYLTKEELL
jgi:glutamate dehydrogenase/leucine dehydrogenase